MSIASLLIPDFTMILLGLFLRRVTNWGEDFWVGIGKLVYYLLFPALLFYLTAHTTLDLTSVGDFLKVTLIAVLVGIVMGWMAKPIFKPGPMIFESGVQTAFRFNSYIALAIASKLAGEQGTALMAVAIGFGIPICNVAAVHALLHKRENLLKELIKHPLLLATFSGILFNYLDITLPEIVDTTLSRLGNATIALGLITVGGGLRLSGLKESKGIATYFLIIKLLVVPAIGYVLGYWLKLSLVQLQIAVLFCALPTIPSTYVLTLRMRGNGPLVAFLVSSGTVLSMITLPMWLALVT